MSLIAKIPTTSMCIIEIVSSAKKKKEKSENLLNQLQAATRLKCVKRIRGINEIQLLLHVLQSRRFNFTEKNAKNFLLYHLLDIFGCRGQPPPTARLAADAVSPLCTGIINDQGTSELSVSLL